MEYNRNINHYENISMKNPSKMIRNLNKFDLHGTLELLHTSSDLDVQVKLLSILSAYLMMKDADTAVVISCNHIYDKLMNVLAKSASRKAAIGLNFLSALLYGAVERCEENLALYAKNMIRTSGCLSTMCDLFTSCIIYQDTWQALCRCLAETCRGVEANQSYCTHLVPTGLRSDGINTCRYHINVFDCGADPTRLSQQCIQRCNQRNVQAFVVLSSLLQNHKRNIELFIDSNGGSLFTREFLQYEACLQLLATLVQSSSQAAARIGKSNVSHDLRDFLQRYGQQSQLGQWAIIILYHISRLDEPSPKVMDNRTSESLKRVIQNQIKIPKESDGDTTMLFQNVVKEILHWEPKQNLKDLQTFMPRDTIPNWDENFKLKSPIGGSNDDTNIMSRIHSNRNKIYLRDDIENNITTMNKHLKPQLANDYSFSFLHKQNVHDNGNSNASEEPAKAQRYATTQTVNQIEFSDSYEINRETHEYVHELTADGHYFKPKSASTPKRNITKSFLNPTKYSNCNSARRMIQKPIKPQKKRVKVKKIIGKKKQGELSNLDKEIKNRSISARFFEAINESCTTLVKTVKSIFVKTNMPENTDNIHTKAAENAPSCSYSFTNYMRKRDAVMINEASKFYPGSNSGISNSCNTCNDTLALRRKLGDDDYLRNTVKKLKVGINLYGCDFKKISKTLWPHDTYMTPVVLYNLYRKLIIK